jgi:methylated-DNA-[protein]-cysteine S-methyltransferase
MTPRHFALFDTAIGTCGIVWSNRGICGTQLPEGDRQKTRARLGRRFPGAIESSAPPEVARAITDIASLLSGEARDFADVTLDLDGVPEFNRRVYDAARRIAPGAATTYGDIATALGEPGAARAVGKALAENPVPIIVPCHRVLAANGKTGGFSAPGGVNTKMRMLTIEGARTSDQPMLFEAQEFAAKPSSR